MPIVTVADLLATLRAHRLVSPELLDAAAKEKLPTDARAAARIFVQRGWLTPYQVNELFLDRGASLLLKSYVLLELLGEGGMGQVFKARNWKLGQMVAVKLIRKERLVNPNTVKRFYREMRAVSQLDHPHIVRALDADEVGGTHFFVMEYVEGIDLYKLVKKQGRLEVPAACDYIRQAALGLQHAHERGLVHRDIKPHNLLVARGEGRGASKSDASPRAPEPSPLIKILDMGLARFDSDAAGDHSSTMTQQGTVMGTPDYIAPEQAVDSHGVDIRADLYSLGCTLHFLLAGKAPFAGGTFMEKVLKHQRQQATPLRQVRGDVPEELESLVAKLMAKRPDERYQTPADLAQALEEVLDGGATAQVSATSMHTAIRSASVGQADTSNVFADLSTSISAPVRLDNSKPLATTAADKKRALRIGLVSAGLVLAVVLLTITVRAFFGTAKPAAVAATTPEVALPVRNKTPSAAELAAIEEKARQQREKKRNEEAAEALLPLAAKAADPRTTFAEFAKNLRAFKATHGGTPAAIQAAQLLAKVSSPLDGLDPAKLPQDCLDCWKALGLALPKELVGVVGEHGPRHWAGVVRVAYSPDGRLFASAGVDGVVMLWDAASKRAIRSIRAHPNHITAMAFRPGGQILATSSHGGGTRLLDVNTSQVIHVFGGHAGVTSLAFSGDGKLLATGGSGDHAIHLWDVGTRQRVRTLTGHKGWVVALAFPKDGRLLASGSRDGTIRLWDIDTGKEPRKLADQAVPGLLEWQIAFSPDGQQLAAVSGTGAVPLKVWDVASGEKLHELPGHATVAFRKGEPVELVSISGADLKFWELSTGKERSTIKYGGCVCADFSPDGRRLVCGHADGTVRLWDMASRKEVQPLTGFVGALNAAPFFPDCQLIVAAGADQKARVWDVTRHTVVRQFSASLAFPTFDGQRILAHPPHRAVDLEGKDLFPLPGAYWAVPPDGRHVLTAERQSGEVRLYYCELETGRVIRTWTCPAPDLVHQDISPDGLQAVTVTGSTIWLWDLEAGKELRHFELDRETMGAPRYLPKGQVITRTSTGDVIFWDMQQKEPVRRVAAPPWTHAAPSPDGTTLLCVTSGQPNLLLWDLNSGKKLQSWEFPGPITWADFAPDGRHLITANGNGTAYILRLDAKKLVQ